MHFIWRLMVGLLCYLSLVGVCLAGEVIVEILNVGQADAILITTPDRKALIDAGEKPSDVADQLRGRGISKLDLVVATHPHADHIGGMQQVLANQTVSVYLDNGFPHTTATYSKLMALVESKVAGEGMRYIVGRKGQRLNLGAEVVLEILSPADEGFSNTRSDINSNSLIIRLTHGANCFLFMADAEAETEMFVAPDVGQCQLLKLAHHGGNHSTVDAFLDVVRPKTALISAGLANRHGHPGKETLGRLEARQVEVYRTDLMGAIKAVSDGKTVRITTEHDTPIQVNLININTAPLKVLKELPGIGDGTAQAIISYREAHGPFKTKEDVLKSAPNQERRLTKILDFITVDGGSSTGLLDDAHAAVPRAGGEADPKAHGLKININTAGPGVLTELHGIGPGRAKAIIEYRQANGPFKSCQDLTKVSGIGDSIVSRLLPQCTVE